jgi:hypothetical protein
MTRLRIHIRIRNRRASVDVCRSPEDQRPRKCRYRWETLLAMPSHTAEINREVLLCIVLAITFEQKISLKPTSLTRWSRISKQSGWLAISWPRRTPLSIWVEHKSWSRLTNNKLETRLLRSKSIGIITYLLGLYRVKIQLCLRHAQGFTFRVEQSGKCTYHS